MKFAFSVQYNGKNLHGYQAQKEGAHHLGEHLPTVQEHLEKALQTILRQPLGVHAAGRTDAGVSAQGQVIHFTYPAPNRDQLPKSLHDLGRFMYSVNSLLPPDISLNYGQQVPDDFHARFSCLGREYVYQALVSSQRMALYQDRSLWLRRELDLELMREATLHLLGEHDFAAFTPAIYRRSGERTVRRVDEIRIIDRAPLLYFYYRGSGFLHNMIRIMTGTLVAVGHHELLPENVLEIRQSLNRRLSGKTVPAYPLSFVNASYHDYSTPRELIPFYRILDGKD